MKNEKEMLEILENEGIIVREQDLWAAGPRYEMLTKPFSEGLTEEQDMEVKETLMAMSVRFLKGGKKWKVQRFGDGGGPEHILISTQPVKNAQFIYHDPKVEKDG